MSSNFFHYHVFTYWFHFDHGGSPCRTILGPRRWLVRLLPRGQTGNRTKFKELSNRRTNIPCDRRRFARHFDLLLPSPKQSKSRASYNRTAFYSNCLYKSTGSWSGINFSVPFRQHFWTSTTLWAVIRISTGTLPEQPTSAHCGNISTVSDRTSVSSCNTTPFPSSNTAPLPSSKWTWLLTIPFDRYASSTVVWKCYRPKCYRPKCNSNCPSHGESGLDSCEVSFKIKTPLISKSLREVWCVYSLHDTLTTSS